MGKLTQIFGKNSRRLVQAFRVDSNIIPELCTSNDCDFYDRLSAKWTVYLCFTLAAISMINHIVGKPVICWHPAHFMTNPDLKWKEYANTHCWLGNTYHLPLHQNIPNSAREREETKVVYYRWVTLFLFAQGIFFYLPWSAWDFFNNIGFIDIRNTVDLAKKRVNEMDFVIDKSKHKLILDTITAQIGQPLQQKRYVGSNHIAKNSDGKQSLQPDAGRICKVKFKIPMATIAYLLMKLCCLFNTLIAIFVINEFVRKNFFRYGYDMMMSQTDDDMASREIFPRITMCDLDIRRLGNNQRYTMQCLLTNNYFFEKMFFILWVWLWIVFAGTLAGILLTLFSLPEKCSKLGLKEKLFNGLALSSYNAQPFEYNSIIFFQNLQNDEEYSDENIMHFIKFLGYDGRLVLRMLSVNVFEECEIIALLWKQFKQLQCSDFTSQQITTSTSEDSSSEKIRYSFLGKKPPAYEDVLGDHNSLSSESSGKSSDKTGLTADVDLDEEKIIYDERDTLPVNRKLAKQHFWEK